MDIHSNIVMDSQPTVVITFDFELGWGHIESALWYAREQVGVYTNLRKVMKVLLAELEVFGIGVTWATVEGMLIPPEKLDLSHLPDKLRNKVLKAIKQGKESSFYGRDILEQILVSRVPHGLASHTYSHTRYSHPSLTAEIVSQDLERSNIVWKEFGVHPDKLVFPMNHEGYYEQLHEKGIRKVRTNEFGKKRGVVEIIQRKVLTGPRMSTAGPEICGVKRENGSLVFNDGRGRGALLKYQMRRGVRKMKRKNGCLHIYTHPFNLAASDELFKSFLIFLKLLAVERDRGNLKIELF